MKPHRRRPLDFAVAALLTALGGAQNSVLAGPLYKWVDEEGKVHYGDRVPPEYANQERKILNERGLEVGKVEAAKTPAELAEERRLAEQRREQERLAAEQAAHDRMLLATFATEEDMVLARDGRISAIDGMIRITRARIDKAERRLEDLTRRAANLERAGRVVPKRLHDDIDGTRQQIERFEAYIVAKRKEQEDIRKQFEADIRRFRELKEAQKKGGEQALLR